jgi:serine/threonine-protein kinase RsbW
MTKYDTHKIYKLESKQGSLDRVEKLIVNLRKKYDIPQDIFYNILISITEAINNAITHGNKNNTEKFIIFEIFSSSTRLLFKIKDEGEGFNPTEVDDCTATENLLKDSGRGIFIMKSLSDTFDVSSSENGTLFTMCFKYGNS